MGGNTHVQRFVKLLCALKSFSVKNTFRLVRSPVRRPTPLLCRISVSDLMQTYSTVLDLHHIKTPEEGLFFIQRCSQHTLEWEVIS